MVDKMNLDQLCAEYGFRFAEEISQAVGEDKPNSKEADNLITKALGVLQEQGLYAFALFCKKEKSGGSKIIEITKDLLKERPLELIGEGDFLGELRKDNGLLTRLDDLLLAIQVLEKSLIYARFHVKAMKESKGEQQ